MTDNPVTRLPHRFDASTMPEFLDKIGLPLPPAASMLVAAGLSLASCGKRYTIKDVDAALSKTRLSTQDCLAVKIGMANHGLLIKAAA